MESWFLADRDALKSIFWPRLQGKRFVLLPTMPSKASQKQKVYSSLTQSTSNCRTKTAYGKGEPLQMADEDRSKKKSLRHRRGPNGFWICCARRWMPEAMTKDELLARLLVRSNGATSNLRKRLGLCRFKYRFRLHHLQPTPRAGTWSFAQCRPTAPSPLPGVTRTPIRCRTPFSAMRIPASSTRSLSIDPQKHDLPEGIVLAFYIPEATRQQKPVYIDGNPKKAYIRRGGRDDTCTGDARHQLRRDASTVRYDARTARRLTPAAPLR